MKCRLCKSSARTKMWLSQFFEFGLQMQSSLKIMKLQHQCQALYEASVGILHKKISTERLLPALSFANSRYLWRQAVIPLHSISARSHFPFSSVKLMFFINLHKVVSLKSSCWQPFEHCPVLGPPSLHTCCALSDGQHELDAVIIDGSRAWELHVVSPFFQRRQGNTQTLSALNLATAWEDIRCPHSQCSAFPRPTFPGNGSWYRLIHICNYLLGIRGQLRYKNFAK